MITNNATVQTLSIVRYLLATLSPEMLSLSIPSLKKEGLLKLRDHRYKTIGELLEKLAGMDGAINRPYIKAVNDIAVVIACLLETSGNPTPTSLITYNPTAA